MILMAGGTDGGTVKLVAETVDLIKAAEPKARLGISYELPIVYAGNVSAREYVKDKLAEGFALELVDNLRPVLEVEKVEPARNAVHELFMEHVMSHAPGYTKLMEWTDVPIMPTPAGEGMMVQLISETLKEDTLGVGLGGATTNVYSVMELTRKVEDWERRANKDLAQVFELTERKFVRSVSANLGMSYSICNVMMEAGMDNIMRWIPFDMDEIEVRNRLRNKMIRPTTIPQTLHELMIEHAVAREALRLGLKHHKLIARGLKGVYRERDAAERFGGEQEESYVDLMKISAVVGTGGLLSHAPRRVQSLQILTDGFLPAGVTKLFQDSVFMMPHLGVLSTVHKDAAWEIFDKDCLVRLGSVIAPEGQIEEGALAVKVSLELPDGSTHNEDVDFGDIRLIQLAERTKVKATIEPSRQLNVGAGPGRRLETEVEGGVVGVVIDARGRPLMISSDANTRKAKLLDWFRNLNMYPKAALDEIER
jgi:uncharacterized protein (TIGR01319 family)